MIDPNTTAVGVATISIPIGAAIIGLDAERAIGALAGAAVFVTSVRDVGVLQRILYLFISVVIGYSATSEIIDNSFVESKVIAGFIGGLISVTLGVVIRETIEKSDTLHKWFGRK